MDTDEKRPPITIEYALEQLKPWDEIRNKAQGYGIEGDPKWMYQWLRSWAKNLDPLASDLLKMFDGWKAFKESDEDRLIRIFETAAKTGRPEYQCDLGYIYRNGFDWECKSIDESDEWFRLAADQGCAGAFYGMAYYGRSEKESSRLYRMAAELGDSSAQYEIGCKLSWPNNSDEDKAVAVGWFRKAAEQGNYRAQNQLGRMYLDGIGTDRSPEEAFRLISLSASAGWSEAQKNLGNMYRTGNGVEQSLEEAVRWYRKGVPHGDFIMGLYESGIDIEDSDDGSVRLIDRFSEENDPEAYAMYILGRLYEAGLGVERSQDKADRWLRLARERSGDQGRRYQTVSQRPCFRKAEREKACSDMPMLSIINR